MGGKGHTPSRDEPRAGTAIVADYRRTGPPGPFRRFVAAQVDAPGREEWLQMSVQPEGGPQGAPAYHSRALLCVWLYDFMTNVRSCRKPEADCRDQIPYLWLKGWQHPDHNTLWRFYQRHRNSMRELFRRTVRKAFAMELVDLAVQAVEGTKVIANAALIRTYDARRLQKLLYRFESAIDSLETQNESDEDGTVARLPENLAGQKALRDRARQAMKELPDRELSNQYKRPARINLTDKDARLIRTRQGIVPSYNAQAMVSPVGTNEGLSGILVTAADVVDEANDAARLAPMVEQAEQVSGVKVPMTLADAGYFAGKHLAEFHRRGQQVAMPDMARPTEHPYYKDQFIYDEKADSYTRPNGETLPFAGLKNYKRKMAREYRVSSGSECGLCPTFGVSSKNATTGRTLEIGPYDLLLRRHREWMATRRSPTSFPPPTASGRATLRDHQEPAWSATIHIARLAQRESGMGNASHGIQFENPTSDMANRS